MQYTYSPRGFHLAISISSLPFLAFSIVLNFFYHGRFRGAFKIVLPLKALRLCDFILHEAISPFPFGDLSARIISLSDKLLHEIIYTISGKLLLQESVYKVKQKVYRRATVISIIFSISIWNDPIIPKICRYYTKDSK